MVGLVEQREVDLGEIGDLDVEPAVRLGPLGEPAGDRQAVAARAGRADDDREPGQRAPGSAGGEVGHAASLEARAAAAGARRSVRSCSAARAGPGLLGTALVRARRARHHPQRADRAELDDLGHHVRPAARRGAAAHAAVAQLGGAPDAAGGLGIEAGAGADGRDPARDAGGRGLGRQGGPDGRGRRRRRRGGDAMAIATRATKGVRIFARGRSGGHGRSIDTVSRGWSRAPRAWTGLRIPVADPAGQATDTDCRPRGGPHGPAANRGAPGPPAARGIDAVGVSASLLRPVRTRRQDCRRHAPDGRRGRMPDRRTGPPGRAAVADASAQPSPQRRYERANPGHRRRSGRPRGRP